MALADFSRDDFDVKEWINQVLDDLPEETPLDSHISAVSMKLQILSADLNDDLERSMTDLVAALPRACSEADRGEGLSEALAKHLQRIEVSLNSIEASTSDQVLVLEKLDVLKRNMEACGQTLTEAANWSALVRECHASFANQQLRKVASELEALRKSEKVLRNVPGGRERTNTLELLSEQLEKLLRPELISLLSKPHRVADVIRMAEMYGRLGKLSVLKEEYVSARPAPLHRVWFSFGPTDTLAVWLPDFHEQVISALGDERRRCVEIFGEGGVDVACKVGTAILDPVIASFAQRLAEKFSLPDCTSAYLQTIRFAIHAMDELSEAEDATMQGFMKAAAAPFVEFQKRLGALEKEHLSAQLDEIFGSVSSQLTFESEEALANYAEEIQSTIPAVVMQGKETVNRIVTLGGGVQAVSSCDAIKFLFSTTTARYSSALDVVRTLSGTEQKKSVSHASRKAKGNTQLAPEEQESLFEWRYLHVSLRMLAIAGRWLQALVEFEHHVTTSLRPLYALLFPQHIPSTFLSSESSSSSPSSLQLPAFKGMGHSGEDISVQALALDLGRKLNGDDAHSKELRAMLLGLPQSTAPYHAKSFSSSSVSGSLLAPSLREALGHSNSTRLLVFDVTMRVIRSSLSAMPKLDVWCGKSSPVYSIQPSGYVTKVGEHLLSLYQELEMFARDETARADATTNGLCSLAQTEWKKLSTLLPLTAAETAALPVIASALKIPGIALHGETEDEDEKDEDAEEEDGEEEAVALFCNEWLIVAVRSTFAIFISKVLGIPKLDECGIAQLSSDLDYLLNVTSALDLDRHALADHFSALLKLPRDEFGQVLNRERLPGAAAGVVRKMEAQFAAVRGVAVAFQSNEE